MAKPKKLIEVALPLTEINDASAYDKMPGIGPHPKGIHHWWARLPLPAARAVLFASVVDDPSSHPERFPTEEAQELERDRLFGIIRRLLGEKLHKHPEVYAEARAEMLKYCDGKLPPVLDPFAGGGSIPLEAARLGMEAYAGDLNPVAVLLNKCYLELVPQWADCPPVNPEVTFLGARASRPHRQWYSRGYLPHLDQPGLVQFITFRLYDSIPAHVMESWRSELQCELSLPATDPRVVELRKRIAEFEDAGHGACYLRDERIAELVQDALLQFDGERYRVLEWAIMPNHVHVLIETLPGYRLGDIVHSWKSFTAKEANRILSRSGEFWMRDYFDRFIRDEKHLASVREYVRNNPVKAGLVEKPEDWPWSSSYEDAGQRPALPGWRGSAGLAADVRYYGRVVLERARERLGHLYPKVKAWYDARSGRYFGAAEVEEWRISAQRGVRNEYGEEVARQCGRPSLSSLLAALTLHELPVIAWIWARTVPSPNPAARGAHVPLMSTFWLSSKKGSEAWLEPVVEWPGDGGSPGTAGVPPAEGGAEDARASGVCGQDGRAPREGVSPSEDGGGIPGTAGVPGTTGAPGTAGVSPANQDAQDALGPGVCGQDGRAPREGGQDGRAPSAPRWRFRVRTGPPPNPEAVKAGTKTGRAMFRCLLTGDAIPDDYIKEHGKAGRMDARLVAIVADAGRGRVYLPAGEEQEAVARKAQPAWRPEEPLAYDPIAIKTPLWGLRTLADHFTPRQLTAMVTLSDLVREVRADIERDAGSAGLPGTAGVSPAKESAQDARAPRAYAATVTTFLALALDRCADYCNALCRWDPREKGQRLNNLFARQAIPMVWDFAEANLLGDSSVCWASLLENAVAAIQTLSQQRPGHARPMDAGTAAIPATAGVPGTTGAPGTAGVPGNAGVSPANQDAQDALGTGDCGQDGRAPRDGAQDARGPGACDQDGRAPRDGGQDGRAPGFLVSTDPPYYDNIGYAALSDFFYVWLRRTIGDLYPDLFGTILVPKEPELVAAPERFDGDKHKAREHFEQGFKRAFAALRQKMDPRFPLTVYYAFKQDDLDGEETARSETRSPLAPHSSPLTPLPDRTTGWETMLTALIETGFQITATWPVRASLRTRMIAMGSNALASYIVLACRPREDVSPGTRASSPHTTQAGGTPALQTDRRSFVAELKRELPTALKLLQQGNIAPVDFAQAAIGPGMAIYSKYSRILEASGRPMSVRTALALINQTLTEVLFEQEDEFDADTRWAIAWYEQYGFEEGEFGEAEKLSKAKVTSVRRLAEAKLVHSKGGKVRLLHPNEFPGDWDPEKDPGVSIWKATHHLLRVYWLEKKGEEVAAGLLRQLGSRGELARDLAYRLYNIAEKKGRSQDAQAYNALVLGWPELARLARGRAGGAMAQEKISFTEMRG